jgi:hypothetical protein
VISLPPWPSEVTLKFAVEYCPRGVRFSTAAPLLTVSVPLAFAPEIVCVQVAVVTPLVRARLRRSISSLA